MFASRGLPWWQMTGVKALVPPSAARSLGIEVLPSDFERWVYGVPWCWKVGGQWLAAVPSLTLCGFIDLKERKFGLGEVPWFQNQRFARHPSPPFSWVKVPSLENERESGLPTVVLAYIVCALQWMEKPLPLQLGQVINTNDLTDDGRPVCLRVDLRGVSIGAR